jgi:cell division septation protein DedD
MKWFPLLAFAHLEELPPDASADEPDPVEEVRAQARMILGDMAQGYADVKQDSRYAIPHEAEITFVPEIPGFEVNPPRRTFLWLESVHREEFRIRAGPQLAGTAVRGRMSVFWGSILLAEVSLAIRVEARIASGPAPPVERAASRPFRNIFPSYSHRDAGIVEEFERYARTLGDRYLRDVHELRAGEVWNDRLKDLIQKADVFQLFWSWNALRSPYVEEEWRYALSLGRPNFVRPTYWQDPLPEEPARSLPPEELRRLHFQLLPGGKGGVDLNATVVAFPAVPKPPDDESEDDATAAAPDEDFLDQIQRGISQPPPLPLARPPLPPAVAAAQPSAPPPLPVGTAVYPGSYSPPPVRSGQRRGNWMGVAAMIAVAVLGLSVFLLRSRSAPEPGSVSTAESHEVASPGPPLPESGSTLGSPGPKTSGPGPFVFDTTPTPAPTPSFPIIDPATWQRLAAACRLDAAKTQETPTRMTAGSPIVQVFSSEDWIDAARTLARFSGRGAFILPREEDGHAVCTVAFGPFLSEQEATQAAAELHASDGVDAKVVPYPEFSR